MKPEKISCFRKKVLGRQLEEFKAYRKQFEVDDDSILSFKPKKSGSPITPKVHLLKCDSQKVIEGGYTADGYQQREMMSEPMVKPVRMNSDLGPILSHNKI